jgi:inosine-uridine nucleoside N-ribohydrolase
MRVFLILLLCGTSLLAQKPRFILDADTANEIDDLYAIAHLLVDTTVDLRGLTSAQWFHHLSGDSTVYQSQRLNEDLLELAGLTELPHPVGSNMIVGKPWGGYEPRPSPAAEFIVEEARLAAAAGEQLAVMSIGAATNLASALAMAPDITPHVVAYQLGLQYDTAGRYWNKSDFNVRRDLNAMNYLLDQDSLELHVMPVTTAIQYKWGRDSTFALFDRAGEMGRYLKRRWQTNAARNDERIMWDVAALQAFLKPEQATEIAVATPPENTHRIVYVYTDIDEDAMARDFWDRLPTYATE